METLRIPWLTGEGNILIDASGESSGLAVVSSDIPNDGLDREQDIRFATTRGLPTKEVVRTVRQEGRYEVLTPADGPVVDRDGYQMWTPKNR